MKTRKVVFIFLASVCYAYSLKAQVQPYNGNYKEAVVQNQFGKALYSSEYVDVVGSAFLTDNWASGSAKLANGAAYKGDLKYDFVKDELVFKGPKDETLLFVDPVLEFIINDGQQQRHFKDGFDISGFTPTSFFEVLADGSVQLLKKDKRTILESTPYNSATPERKFIDVYKYYIVSQGKAVEIKKDAKSFLGAIGNKQTELDTYIKINKLNLKNDDDMAKVVVYYNSL